MKRILLAIIVMLTIQSISAQVTPEPKPASNPRSYPLRTDRPGISESPFLVERRDLQLETGFNYEFDATSGARRSSITYHSSLLKFGLTENCELRIVSDYVQNHSINLFDDTEANTVGFMPLTIGSKILVVRERGICPQVSFIGYLQLPFATAVYKPTYAAPILKITAQHTLHEKLTLAYNLGSKWDGERAKATSLYTLSLGLAVSKRVGLFLESYGFITHDSPSDHRADTGLTCLLADNFQLDLSGGLGFSATSPDGFVNCGLSWRIPQH